MVMPAFDMEPNSTSASPDGTVAPASGEDAATASPAGPEAGPARAPTEETAPTKPRPASLVSIPVKNKPAAPVKAGDLTRLFELARRQAVTPSAPPPDAKPEPVVAATSALLESPPKPMPPAIAPMETPLAKGAPELTAEPAAVVEPAIVSETALKMPAPSFEIDSPILLAPPSVAPEIPDAVTFALVEPVPAADPVAKVVASAAPIETPLAAQTMLAPEPPESASAPPKFTTEAPNEEISAEIEALKRPLDIAPSEAKVEANVLDEPEAPRLAEPPHPVAPTPRPEPIAPRISPAAKITELADYWRSLRVGEDHPAIEAVDHALVTERWPGSLLIAYTPASQDPRGELRPGRVTRLGTACVETQNVVDAGSHATEWMLEVARTALINDDPVEEQQRLATLTGVAGFRMVALPLGPPKGLANAVLCTLLPSPNAPRFGKRRIWL